MREIIFNSGNADTLASEAGRLGFMDADGHIIVNGVFATGGGWFLNIAGIVYEPIVGAIDSEDSPPPVARDGYWGRLRINGDPETMPTFSDQIIQYVWDDDLGGWTNDGVTLAPDWVGLIGMIA